MDKNINERTDLVYLFHNCTNVTSTDDNFESLNCTTATRPNRNLDTYLAASLSLIDLYLVCCTWTYYYRFSQKRMNWTNRICCISAFALLLETCWYQSEIQLEEKVSDEFCQIFTTVNLILSIGNRALIYVVLWIRQRSFYKTCSIFSSSRINFNHLSWVLLAGIVGFFVMQILVLSTVPLEKGIYGCIARKPTAFVKIATPIVFFAGSLFQSLLLGPVLYPLYKHAQERRKNKKSLAQSGTVFKRLSLCSAICIVTDFIFIALSVQHPGEGFSFSFIPICYSINMIINVLAMLTSFADSKTRLFPFLAGQKNLQSLNRVSTKTQAVVTVL